MGRQPTNTKLSSNKTVRRIRIRGGNVKWRALRLDTGNYSWRTVKQLPARPESLTWSSMPLTTSLSVQRHLSRVPFSRWMLLPSSSGTSSTMVLRLAARRRMLHLPQRKLKV